METIGLIAAMTQESSALLQFVPRREKVSLKRFSAARFQLTNRACLLATSGIGIERATDCARSLVASAHPQLLISFGIAGAVNANLDIGDVVVSTGNCAWESGAPTPLHPLAALSKQAWDAAAHDLQPERVQLVTGIAITTRGSQVIPDAAASLTNPILEMETAGIARVAAESGTPFLSIRSISDGPRAPIPIDLEAVMDEQYDLRIGKLLGMVVRHPRLFGKLPPMMQNSAKAARCCAVAVFAVLNQPSAIISV